MYLGKNYYAVYQQFLSVIDHLDYHPGMHPIDTPSETLDETNTNHGKFKHHTRKSCETWQQS